MSTVIISIEEFEDLIKCKRKLEKIKELKDSNVISIRETNRLGKRAVIDGDMETVGKLVFEQDNKNLIYMSNIIKVLESEDE